MSISYYKDIYESLSNKYPNSNVYVISDHHFYHNNIIAYERSQFSDVLEMNNHIIFSHNDTVSKDDIVIFLGDFSFKNGEIKNILSRMNGHKYLLVGNHDKSNLINTYATFGFEGIFTVPIKFQDAYLSHYPINSDSDVDVQYHLLLKEFQSDDASINYHGHIHTVGQNLPNYMNVTCDALDYKPLLIGRTKRYSKDSKPLLINSNIFDELLKIIKEEKNMNYNLLLSDYIYCMMLEANSKYLESTYIYGSYPQYKKYGYESNFSDLDLGVIYNDSISKNKNTLVLKSIIDEIYSSINGVDCVNISFIKRIINMCAFEFRYTNGKGINVPGALDTNLIPVNFLKDSDFQINNGYSFIEKSLYRKGIILSKEYHLPHYQARFLTSEGDISNLILLLLFQNGNNRKKDEAIKKIRYISKYYDSSSSSESFEDILTRFFLKNILFMHTLRRYDEIEYIKQTKYTDNKYLELLPPNIKELCNYILNNPSSFFNMMYDEIVNTPVESINDKSKTLVKQLK